MSSPRERFEAYLRAQVEGSTNEEAKAMGTRWRIEVAAMLGWLWNDGHRDLTINDAVAVLALGKYLQPADPEERLKRGLDWLEGMKGKRDE